MSELVFRAIKASEFDCAYWDDDIVQELANFIVKYITEHGVKMEITNERT